MDLGHGLWETPLSAALQVSECIQNKGGQQSTVTVLVALNLLTNLPSPDHFILEFLERISCINPSPSFWLFLMCFPHRKTCKFLAEYALLLMHIIYVLAEYALLFMHIINEAIY